MPISPLMAVISLSPHKVIMHEVTPYFIVDQLKEPYRIEPSTLLLVLGVFLLIMLLSYLVQRR